ncbi:hypothetical protein B0A48_13573 [Cryoendolithus antarcticus]|uniref:SET domain-containing protein n=1 Tax=Cryoendolithus antarcticus TaxID=1507870 RepID=A0A1V8SNZ3_9PEZI|nr:hypothetical protein B0A48_13573 [Cryoendolithus antarcticus]
MAEDYVKLLKQQEALLATAKKRQGQLPQPRTTRRELEQEYERTGLSDLRARNGNHLVKQTFIGEAYKPSIADINDLKPIHLRELRLETHHLGRILIVPISCNAVRITAVQTGIEDEHDRVERLAVCNTDLGISPSQTLPRGSVLAIKEPYYKATSDGGVIVRVDHPSDFLILNEYDPIIPLSLRPRVQAVEEERSAEEVKKEGNVAVGLKQYRKATRLYTVAIALCGDDDAMLGRALHRNRALSNHYIGHYEAAHADAIAAIIPDVQADDTKSVELNTKAHLRAGRASYELGHFEDAARMFTEAIRTHTDNDVNIELARALDRLREAKTGLFSFLSDRFLGGLPPRLDCASIVKNTEVRASLGRRKGLFAVKSFSAGDLILCEKAFCSSLGSDDNQMTNITINLNTKRMSVGTHASLHTKLVTQLQRNPKQASAYLELYDGTKSSSTPPATTANPPIDVFRVQSILELNAFGLQDAPPPSSPKKAAKKALRPANDSTAIFLRASYMNHACDANAYRTFISDMLVLRATRAIAMDEELTIAYTRADPASADYGTTFSHWGFTCECVVCKAETHPKGSISHRRKVVREADESANDPANEASDKVTPSKAQVAAAEKLLKRVEGAYRQPGFEPGVPKLGATAIAFWLMRAHMLDSCDPEKCIKLGTTVLASLGFDVVVDTAVYLSQLHEVVEGKESIVSAQYAVWAEEMWAVCRGSKRGFGERYGV